MKYVQELTSHRKEGGALLLTETEINSSTMLQFLRVKNSEVSS